MANTLTFLLKKNVSSFCIANASSHFFAAKNINVFENTLATTVNEFVINELVRLTMLWTTGPWLIVVGKRIRDLNFAPYSDQGKYGTLTQIIESCQN